MRVRHALAALALLVTVPFVFGACEFIDDDDSAAEDDDDWPEYEGEIDIQSIDADISCYPDAESVTGSWDFVVFLEGWAEFLWVELWSLEDSYCEGFDTTTGYPCDIDGVERPGWDMERYDYGFDDTLGFWDEWELQLGYDTSSWPASASESYLGCDNDVEFYICGCDEFTGNCYCSDPLYR